MVLAVDVPDEGGRPGDFTEPTLVEVGPPIPMSRVVSGHVDDLLAVADIAKAVVALPGGRLGDDDARSVVDGAEGHELLWYATQELPYVNEE